MIKIAFSSGTIDAERDDRMFLSAFIRPNRRSTRRARTKRNTLRARLVRLNATMDNKMMTESKTFHPLETKGVNQFANKFIQSSSAKNAVKNTSIAEVREW